MTTLPQITPAANQDVPINENFAAVSPAALFSRRYGTGISGLVFGYYGGVFEGMDVPNGTVTLPASEANVYIVAARGTGVVSQSTSTTNWNNATDYFRIGIATTGASTITAFSDKRQAFSTPTNADGSTKTCLAIACSDETTALTAGAAKVTFINPYSSAFTVVAAVASLTVAQTSGSVFTVDVNVAGSSILSTKLTIDNTEKSSATASTPPVISSATIAAYDEITVDIDQVGDGTAKGLKLYLVGSVA